jgi:DNA-binding NarL/FixJ family response regulator
MSQQAPVRVLIVDDYDIIREGLAAMLSGQPDMLLVGAAADGDDALALVQATNPDIVLLDLAMPTVDGGMDSLKTLHAIRQLRPDTRIIVLTSLTDDVCIQAALKAGASGYLPKDACRDYILAAVRSPAARALGTDPSGV